MVDNQALLEQLAARGVRHLRGIGVPVKTSSLDAEELITGLATHLDPRFREALIPLFIRRPEFAALVPPLVVTLDEPAALVLRHLYTAAVYLQCLWRSTLTLYLGDYPLLPDYFGPSFFGLHNPTDHFGEAGLRALAEQFKIQTGYEWLSVYHSTMNLLLSQLRLEYHDV